MGNAQVYTQDPVSKTIDPKLLRQLFLFLQTMEPTFKK